MAWRDLSRTVRLGIGSFAVVAALAAATQMYSWRTGSLPSIPSFSQGTSIDDFLEVNTKPNGDKVFKYNTVAGQTKEADVTGYFQRWDDKHHDDTYGVAHVKTEEGKPLTSGYEPMDAVFVVAPVRRAKKPTEPKEFAYVRTKINGDDVLTYKVHAGEEESDVRERFDKWKGEHKQPYKKMTKGNGDIVDASGNAITTFTADQEVYIRIERTKMYHFKNLF